MSRSTLDMLEPDAFGGEDTPHAPSAETLRKEIASMTTPPPPETDRPWFPIETAPKDGTWVECTNEIWTRPVRSLQFDYNVWIDEKGFGFSPTHWRPLEPTTEKGI